MVCLCIEKLSVIAYYDKLMFTNIYAFLHITIYNDSMDKYGRFRTLLQLSVKVSNLSI